MSRNGAFWVCLYCFWFLHQAESNTFIASPGVVRGDVNGSAALEWTLQSEPERDDGVRFTFNNVDVFRYIPYTGVFPPPVLEGPAGNPSYVNGSYDPRFSIYNTSNRGVGFRLAGLSLEDAGTYTCRYETLSAPITMDAVLFVYDGPYNLMINPRNPSARESDTLGITASAYCNPACSFTWSIGDDVISQGTLLKFDKFQPRDANNYTLRAENAYGAADLSVEVTLHTTSAPSPDADNFIVIVASAAAGGVVLLLIIIVIAVCCTRRRRKQKDDASVEDLVPYGSTTANDTRGFANEAVAADQGTTLYAEVGKEHNRVGKPATKQDVEAPPPAIYAQVNKTKKGKKDKTEREDETNGGPEPVLYAQVDKNRPRKGKDKAKENGQRAVPDELTVPVPSHYDDVEGASAPHADHVTSAAEDSYTDIASAGHAYSNTEDGQGQPLRPPKKVKGFTYSDLTFVKDTEARPEVIHSKEPPTQYSEVDFSRTAPPSN